MAPAAPNPGTAPPNSGGAAQADTKLTPKEGTLYA